jgi:flagellar biosynthetic protein FliP
VKANKAAVAALALPALVLPALVLAALALAALALAAMLLPTAAMAQSFSVDLGQGDHGTTGRLVQITALFTVLSLAPSLLVMVTGFTRIVVVLTLLRGALGAQGTPPNVVVIGFSLFLTFFVMQPVLDRAWTEGVQPMVAGTLPEMQALQRAAEPFRGFMVANTKPADLQSFEEIGHIPASDGPAPWRALIPAFMVCELRRAFEMGFLLYLPFTIIDLVVSSVLMSLGMMMLPPNGVSLPFKLIFFVMVDGWRMVAGSLTESFMQG